MGHEAYQHKYSGKSQKERKGEKIEEKIFEEIVAKNFDFDETY